MQSSVRSPTLNARCSHVRIGGRRRNFKERVSVCRVSPPSLRTQLGQCSKNEEVEIRQRGGGSRAGRVQACCTPSDHKVLQLLKHGVLGHWLETKGVVAQRAWIIGLTTRASAGPSPRQNAPMPSLRKMCWMVSCTESCFGGTTSAESPVVDMLRTACVVCTTQIGLLIIVVALPVYAIKRSPQVRRGTYQQ